MPERNLVSVQNVLIFVALIGCFGLTGCSKLGNSAYQYDRLVDGTSELGWDIDANNSEKLSELQERAKKLESAASFMTEAESTATDDVAHIVAVASQATGIASKPIKLVASPVDVNLLAKQAETHASEDNTVEACAHEAKCDCHKKRVPLKLAHVEPIEMPPSIKTTSPISTSANFAPPRGVISQPLSPLTPIPTQVSDDFETASQTIDQNLNRLRNLNPANLAEFKLSKSSSDTFEQKKLRPQVASEPVVIVATVSPDDVPPFAEEPVSAETFVVTNAEAFSEQFAGAATTAKAKIEKAAHVIDTLDDVQAASDKQWDEMFAACIDLCPGCQVFGCDSAECVQACSENGCKAGTCRDVDCGKLASKVIVVPETNTTNGGNFQPPGTESPVTAAHFQGGSSASDTPIQTIQDESSANQFVPASFTTDVPTLKYEVVKPDLKNLQLPLPANSFAPAETTPVEVAEDDLSKADVDIAAKPQTFIPGTATEVEFSLPSIHAEPQVQDQPEVKVIHKIEVIDNTIPWDVQLEETINKVKSDMNSESDLSTRNGLEVNLRLLQVLQRQLQTVEEHRQVLSDQEKSYWQHQLDAINLMLDSQNSEQSDFARHNAALETLAHLRKAVEGLESIANLQLTNATFCRQVTGFGQFTPFQSATFKSDQKMLVYCEVENFKSFERGAGAESRFQTSLRGSYAVYDQQGGVVQQAEYPLVEDVVRKRRRDFYMYFPVQLKQLPVGIYRMELLVEDIVGNKTATMQAMEFQVR